MDNSEFLWAFFQLLLKLFNPFVCLGIPHSHQLPGVKVEDHTYGEFNNITNDEKFVIFLSLFSFM